MKTIRVMVKAEHIARGGKAAFNDPTALAIRDRLAAQDPKHIEVWLGRVKIDGKIYGLPSVCNQATATFLATGTCPAFEFQLSNEPIQ